jgi:hypothetical protein
MIAGVVQATTMEEAEAVEATAMEAAEAGVVMVWMIQGMQLKKPGKIMSVH